MDQQKQVEAMAKTMCKNYGDCHQCMFFASCDVKSFALRMHEADYHKSSEVVREFFAEIEKIIKDSEYEAVDDYDGTTTICHSVVCIMSGLDKLRKKYMQERES